jgi:hypothetical protein
MIRFRQDEDTQEEAKMKLNRMSCFPLEFHDSQNQSTIENLMTSNYLFLMKNFVRQRSNRSLNSTQKIVN